MYGGYEFRLPVHVSLSHDCHGLQASLSMPHLQELASMAQKSPVILSTQESPVPHLHTFCIESQCSGNLHASRLDVHMHILFAESQYDPVILPSHEDEKPHIQAPLTHFSPRMLHVTPPHGFSRNFK